MATYDKGDLVRLSAIFRDSAGVLADPTAVTLQIRNPGWVDVMYTYGVGTAIVQDSAGLYHLDYAITTSGRHFYRWVGTGTVSTTEETSFYVRPQRT